jgi:hypothetical protein
VETQQYRKGSKALLVLIPLLGLTYVLVIAGPTEGLIAIYFSHIRAVLLSTQVCHFLLSLNIRLNCLFFTGFSRLVPLSISSLFYLADTQQKANSLVSKLYEAIQDERGSKRYEYPSISTLANHFTRKLARVSTSKAN